MTREKEIIQQATLEAKANRLAYPEAAVKETFIKGAQWADKTTIDRACEYLAKVLPDEIGFVDANIVIVNFRETMEK